MPRFFDYSRWDGRQKVELDADDLLAAMADDVLADGDAWRALQRLMHQGVPPGEGQQRRRGLQDAMSAMTPEDMARMREMLQDLNKMLRERAEGNEPDFEAFKQKWGDQFPNAESLDDLLEQMGRQMAQMQSLMQSLSPGQRQQLDEMMRSLMMKDERLEGQLRQLAMNLSDLLPMDEMAQRYPV